MHKCGYAAEKGKGKPEKRKEKRGPAEKRAASRGTNVKVQRC